MLRWVVAFAVSAFCVIGCAADQSDPVDPVDPAAVPSEGRVAIRNDGKSTNGSIPSCGPAPYPHYMLVNGVCLPSCGMAGGNYCSNVYYGPSNVGETWDCRYCYSW